MSNEVRFKLLWVHKDQILDWDPSSFQDSCSHFLITAYLVFGHKAHCYSWNKINIKGKKVVTCNYIVYEKLPFQPDCFNWFGIFIFRLPIITQAVISIFGLFCCQFVVRERKKFSATLILRFHTFSISIGTLEWRQEENTVFMFVYSSCEFSCGEMSVQVNLKIITSSDSVHDDTDTGWSDNNFSTITDVNILTKYLSWKKHQQKTICR